MQSTINITPMVQANDWLCKNKTESAFQSVITNLILRMRLIRLINSNDQKVNFWSEPMVKRIYIVTFTTNYCTISSCIDVKMFPNDQMSVTMSIGSIHTIAFIQWAACILDIQVTHVIAKI